MKKADPLVELLWEGLALPKRGPRPTLSLPVIAQAGIELADEGGLLALTMEGVAQRLGLTKMALYRYVPGKAELVALMVDYGLGPPNTTARAKSWRAPFRAWAHALFERFSAHPWALEATLGARVMGPNEVAWLESALGLLVDSGLRAADKLDVVVTVVGHVRHLVQQAPGGARAQTERDLLGALRELTQHRAESYPMLSAVLDERAHSRSAAEGAALDFGLDCIFDGIEAQMARASSRAKKQRKSR